MNPLIHVLHLRGTFEPVTDPATPSGTFIDALDRSKFLPITVDYLADYGMPTAFRDSVRTGRANAITQILSSEAPYFLLSGYSQGALIAGDLARDIAAGAVPYVDPERLVGVALLADPLRPAGTGATGMPGPIGYGIAGQRRIPNTRAWWGTASHDPIATMSPFNPLRTTADLTAAFTTDPRGWDAWARDMWATISAGKVQPWWKFWARPQRWGDAAASLDGYLRRGWHTDDYIREGVAVGLAQVLNREVWP